MPINPSFNWSRLQNVYYDIRTCYSPLTWSIDNLYASYRVASSPNCTLIAIASKAVPFPNLVEIYNPSGTKIWSVVYNGTVNDHIYGFYFYNEDLVLVLSNGKYRYYQDFVGNFNEFSLIANTDTVLLDDLSESRQGANDEINIDDIHISARKITNLENNETEEINNILEVQLFGKYLVTRFENKIIITDLDSNQNYQLNILKLAALDIYTTAIFFEKDKSENGNEFEIKNGGSSGNENLLLYLAYKNTIIVIKVDLGLSNFDTTDQKLTDGPFVGIAVSPTGRLLSLHNSSSKKIFVVSNAFDQILLEYNTANESSSPYQVEWCGNDAIVLSLKDEVKLIGPGQQSISFFYDLSEEDDDFDLDNLLSIRDSPRNDSLYTVPILQSAMDGLWLTTSTKVQFLSRVPEKSLEMYQIGSHNPSAILADCVDKFISNASKANANISLLKNDNVLTTAIDDCLEVALEEFDVARQKRALRAVSFGKIYEEDNYDADRYLAVLSTVKVLNQLRSPELGIFLTYKEIEAIGWESVVKMLLRRNQHYLALKIIKELELTDLISLVYVHWCCYKIRKELDISDFDLYKIITRKLLSFSKDGTNYISVDRICDIAREEGRAVLSKLINNLEPSISKKVKKLVDLEEVELALIKSFQSGDYDLCLLMLSQLQDTLTVSEFFKILNQNVAKFENEEHTGLDVDIDIKTELFQVRGEVVGHTWSNSLGKLNPKLMERFLEHEDKVDELNLLKLKEFKKANPDPEGEEYYNEYKSLLKKCLKKSSQTVIQKALQRELSILELQRRLEKTYLANFYNENSPLTIIERLVKMNQIKSASKIVKELSVSQEKYWFLVLKTYSQSHEFDRLYEFAFGSLDSTTGKSPIGFEPFVEAGFEYDAPKEHISAYISNSVKYKYDEKINLYIKNEDYDSAAQEAVKNKDIDILKSLQQKVPSTDTHANRVIRNSIRKLGY